MTDAHHAMIGRLDGDAIVDDLLGEASWQIKELRAQNAELVAALAEWPATRPRRTSPPAGQPTYGMGRRASLSFARPARRRGRSRNESTGCAALVERTRQRACPMDSAGDAYRRRHPRPYRAMSSVIGIAAGMGLLLVSLATRNDDTFVPWITSWLGAEILVIAGTGKLFFLDE